MNFLIDTNIIIPLEPVHHLDLSVNTSLALSFHQLVSKSGNTIFIHPSTEYDLKRDRNLERSHLINTILDSTLVGEPVEGSNNWVDNQLLAALQADLVDYLVTEDIGIHKKSRRLNIDSRVLFLEDAVSIIRDFFDNTPPPPPSVENVYVYQINVDDPIFDSLRSDYDGFGNWFQKCKREQRKAYVIREKASSNIAAIAIIKRENEVPNGPEGKVLKLCTFKVSKNYSGNRYGELLFKALFDFMSCNEYECTYFTVFSKHEKLIDFAKDFGFIASGNKKATNEIILHKNFKYSTSEVEKLSPLDFNIAYGPMVTSFAINSSFIIPIRPEFHATLFPEMESQKHLFPSNRPCGNSIKKAYLSHSKTKQVEKGDNIIFYRSHDLKSITCIGIVEGSLRSKKPNEIARYVGKRTVYSYSEIQDLCSKPVLAIKFRLVKEIKPAITLRSLRANGIINGQPQSITKVKPESVKWLKQKIMM